MGISFSVRSQVLRGDSGLAAEPLISMVKSSHEIGPSELEWGTHAPLTDGFRVDAHRFKDSNGGSDRVNEESNPQFD